jgi:YVTN family beta-propeller protein
MPDNKPQGSSVRLLSLVVTLVAVVGLFAVVFVRSRADTTSTKDVNQSMDYSPTSMTLTNQALMQESATTTIDVGGINGATPLNNVHLTAGSLSDPIHLMGTIVNNNGVNLVLIGKSSATLHVIAVHGATQQTGSCKDIGDGTMCWEANYTGDQFASSGVLTADSSRTATQATLDVPINLPYFALDGTWTVYWQLVPVDVSANANPSYALDNFGTSVIRMTVDQLVAIDVSANNGSEALYRAVGGGSIAPLVPSAPVTISVVQKGNVVDYDKVYGTDWTNASNGQTMPVSITHFLGTSLPAYGNKDAQELGLGGPDYAIQVVNAGKTDWVVPITVGSQDGTVKTAGTNHYDTMIMSPAGRTGSFSATLTNIAAVARVAPPSNSPLTIVGTAELSANPTGIVSSNGLTVVTHYTSALSGEVQFISTETPSSPMIFPSSQSMNTTPDGLGLAVSGTDVYVANYDEGTLSVFDASAPTDPVYHTVNVGTNPDAIAVSGSYVYVLNQGDGTMSVVNVSSTNSPSVVATLNGFSVPTTIAINQTGTTAYVYDSDNEGIAVVNIQDPENPSITSWFGNTGLGRMTVSGQRLYVVDFGLSIYDISSPLVPELLGQTPTVAGYSGFAAEQAAAIRVSGNYAYVSDHSGLITVVDVSDPNNPVPVDSLGLQVAGDVMGIDIDGSYLYGVDAVADSLFVVDIANTSYQTAVGPLGQLANGAYSADLYGSNLVTTGFYAHNLSVVSTSNPAAPAQITSLSNLGYIRNVRVSGSHAFAYSNISGQNRFLSINLATTPPTLDYSLTVPANLGGDITISGSRAYLKGFQYNLLGVIDISNPAVLSYLGTVYQSSGLDMVSSVTVVGTTAYIASTRTNIANQPNNQVLVYDVSNPASPQFVKSITVGMSPSRVIADGGRVYVANETDKTVSVIDATTAVNASVVATFSVYTQPLSLYVRNDRLYVSGLNTTGVYTIPDSPSTVPTFVRNIPGGGSGGQTVVSADARYLYGVLPTGYSTTWDWTLTVSDLGTN